MRRAENPDMMLSTCAMCGLCFDPAEHTSCDACPLQSGCALACCPSCGYSFVDPDSSRVVRLGARLSSRVRRLREGSAPGSGTLRNIPAGATARIADVDGLPLRQRELLQAYGLAPGRSVEVLQASPVTVVRVDHVEIAFEPTLAQGIRVEVAHAPEAVEA